MEDVFELIIIIFFVIAIPTALIVGTYAILTKVNINMGPYRCIDINNNEIICEQTWRSYGTLYGITEDGKTIDLKSYESVKE